MYQFMGANMAYSREWEPYKEASASFIIIPFFPLIASNTIDHCFLRTSAAAADFFFLFRIDLFPALCHNNKGEARGEGWKIGRENRRRRRPFINRAGES